MPAPDKYPKRRHAVLHLGIPELAALIDLADNARIHRVIARQNPDGLAIVIDSPDFEEVEHDAEAPYLYRTSRQVMVDDDGVTWVRWSVG